MMFYKYILFCLKHVIIEPTEIRTEIYGICF